MKNPLLGAVIAGFVGLASSLACAQPVTNSAAGSGQPTSAGEKPRSGDGKSEDDWRFAVTVYGWATNMSGSATARGNTVDINASVIDLIQKSNSLLGWDSYFEANKGRFGIFGDVVWAKLGIPLSAAAYANPIAGVRLSAQANAAITQSLLILEGGALYEVAKWPASATSFTAIDVQAGVRYWNFSTQVNLDLTGTINFSDPRLAQFDRTKSIGIADSGTLDWVDPLIGLRLRHQFTPSQQIMVSGDVGGFGIPGSSLFSWQAVGIYSYTWQFTGYSLSAVAGYRALSVDKDFGSGINASNLNLVLHGPLVGMTVKF